MHIAGRLSRTLLKSVARHAKVTSCQCLAGCRKIPSERQLYPNAIEAQPVAASAVCNARAKLDETVFKSLHCRILEQAGLADAGKRWKGHRIFAVDGTKINLPRPLIEEGYRTPSRLVHYPQGLVSCLYQLRSKIPVDFDLHAHENEREAALAHLKALSENDVVVYGRGYYSWEMLHAHAVRGLHPVFRIKRSSAFDAFIAGRETEAIIDVAPGKKVLRRLRLKHGCDAAAPCRLRLVKYTAGETVFVLGTTLLDRKTYPAQDLRDLYLGRWGIEELYKISKQLMTVQDFHGQSGRGVKQELYAHFILITLTFSLPVYAPLKPATNCSAERSRSASVRRPWSNLDQCSVSRTLRASTVMAPPRTRAVGKASSVRNASPSAHCAFSSLPAARRRCYSARALDTDRRANPLSSCDS